MKASELKDKTAQELKALLGEQRRAQFKLRLVKSGGDLVKMNDFKMMRRNIARILTILTQIEGKA